MKLLLISITMTIAGLVLANQFNNSIYALITSAVGSGLLFYAAIIKPILWLKGKIFGFTTLSEQKQITTTVVTAIAEKQMMIETEEYKIETASSAVESSLEIEEFAYKNRLNEKLLNEWILQYCGPPTNVKPIVKKTKKQKEDSSEKFILNATNDMHNNAQKKSDLEELITMDNTMARIISWEVEEPDEDGEVSFSVEVELKNNTDLEIRKFKYDCVFTNNEGVPFASSIGNNEECFLEPSENTTFTIYDRATKGTFLKGSSTINATITGRIFTREFHKLGEISLPKSHNEKSTLVYDLQSNLLDTKASISIELSEPDEDGDISTDIKTKISNKSGYYLEGVELKGILIDAQDEQIDETSSEENIAPHSVTMLNPSIWGQKKGKLKNSKLKLSLSVFEQVNAFSIAGQN